MEQQFQSDVGQKYHCYSQSITARLTRGFENGFQQVCTSKTSKKADRKWRLMALIEINLLGRLPLNTLLISDD